jgi:2-dehydro-3-deoxyphosphogluconate aldolase/(4S)-4-hydroxy-2-oxoglutarate aldolase
MLRAFSGPIPDARFCPTGGVTLTNAPTYLALPNVVCVGGTWMLKPEHIESGNWAAITELASAAAALRP